MNRTSLLIVSLMLTAVAGGGCARASLDTAGFEKVDSVTVNAEFMETWQAAKQVLREMELDIYTRDTRGRFVAHSDITRRFHVFAPHRTQYTITLERIASETTKVSIETLDQEYGVMLMTYPGWHDRETTDTEFAQSIIQAIEIKLS